MPKVVELSTRFISHQVLCAVRLENSIDTRIEMLTSNLIERATRGSSTNQTAWIQRSALDVIGPLFFSRTYGRCARLCWLHQSSRSTCIYDCCGLRHANVIALILFCRKWRTGTVNVQGSRALQYTESMPKLSTTKRKQLQS